MFRKFLILASAISLAMFAGCDASVCVGSSDGVTCDPGLNSSTGITISGTVAPLTEGTTANISKAAGGSNANISKATLTGGICTVKNIRGVELISNSIDGSGNFTLLLLPGHNHVILWCYLEIDGVIQPFPSLHYISLENAVAGDSKLDQSVGPGTTLSVFDLFILGGNTSPLNPGPVVDRIANEEWPIKKIYDASKSMVDLGTADNVSGSASSGAIGANRIRLQIISNLFANPSFTTTIENMTLLLQGDLAMIQLALTYYAPEGFTLGSVQASMAHVAGFNQLAYGFINDPSVKDLFAADPAAAMSLMAAMLGSFDSASIDSFVSNPDKTPFLTAAREIFGEYYVSNGVTSFDRFAGEVMGHFLVEVADAAEYEGKWDVLKAYLDSMSGDAEILALAGAAEDRTTWSTGLGISLKHVLNSVKESGNEEAVKGLAEAFMRLAAQDPSVLDEAMTQSRLAALVQSDEAKEEDAKSCNLSSACPDGEVCAKGISICTTPCLNGDCPYGANCVQDDQCETNYCNVSKGGGSCDLREDQDQWATYPAAGTDCTQDAQCKSNKCVAGVCWKPTFLTPLAAGACITFNDCKFAEFPDDRMLCDTDLHQCKACFYDSECIAVMGDKAGCVGADPGKRCTPVKPVVQKPQCSSYTDCKIDVPGNKNFNMCVAGLCGPCNIDSDCSAASQMGDNEWKCLVKACVPPPFAGIWNRTTVGPPSSVSGCGGNVNNNGVTINANGDNTFTLTKPSAPPKDTDTVIKVTWNGVGQACTATADPLTEPPNNCASCTVTGLGGNGTVVSASSCDLPGPDTKNCTFSYIRAAPLPPPP